MQRLLEPDASPEAKGDDGWEERRALYDQMLHEASCAETAPACGWTPRLAADGPAGGQVRFNHVTGLPLGRSRRHGKWLGEG